ncbi:MAG: DUF3047 domain-containing protein [Gemmatimonadetes bacterium]|nr:DUF3047 domain-containing protein [Gemmatimonadota bacterium]NIU30147.1 DUF3047 domain-containing protein [Gemmatimonadota bacterium]NIW63219.1 DUF3047 domain-containing protein [Gemmatimonadota bacterium]NIX38587.1 DUF3047 domain-containing protein [Gemmatimonadota bacterium]
MKSLIPPAVVFVLAAGMPGSPEDRSGDPPVVQVRDSSAVLAEDFSAGWEDRWTEERLDSRRTEYGVFADDGNPVLMASSQRSASALTRTLPPGGDDAVRVSWRWKVAGTVEGDHDERERGGDDYAARVFVIFGSGGFASAEAALSYVWASSEPRGTVYRNPYVKNVATVVLRTGDDRAGQWISEERKVMADYRRAFGQEPDPVSALALMVDTDDTGSEATAWFDDVVVRR